MSRGQDEIKEETWRTEHLDIQELHITETKDKKIT